MSMMEVVPTRDAAGELSARTFRSVRLPGASFVLAALFCSQLAGQQPASAASSVDRQTLGALTVPATALPSGCALTPPAPPPAPISPGGVTVVDAARSPRFLFPTNPWTGTDRRALAAAHLAIDPTPARKPLPDVPLPPMGTPMGTRGAAPSELKGAENILEAYHAAYTSEYGYEVQVYAVTFNDVKLTAAPESLSGLLNPPRGFTSRVVRGATVIRVSSPTPGECARAIYSYIRALK